MLEYSAYWLWINLESSQLFLAIVKECSILFHLSRFVDCEDTEPVHASGWIWRTCPDFFYTQNPAEVKGKREDR